MAQTISHEAEAQVKTNNTPSPDPLADVSKTLMGGYRAFRFLADTFGAYNATDADLTLSSDGAAGLAHMCELVGEELLNAYGILLFRGAQ